MHAAPVRGSLKTPADVKVRRWGESEAVAYSGANAKTHIISEAAAHILLLAAGEGLDEAALARAFWADDAADVATTPEDQLLFRDSVDALLAVGLLTRPA